MLGRKVSLSQNKNALFTLFIIFSHLFAQQLANNTSQSPLSNAGFLQLTSLDVSCVTQLTSTLHRPIQCNYISKTYTAWFVLTFFYFPDIKSEMDIFLFLFFLRQTYFALFTVDMSLKDLNNIILWLIFCVLSSYRLYFMTQMKRKFYKQTGTLGWNENISCVK